MLEHLVETFQFSTRMFYPTCDMRVAKSNVTERSEVALHFVYISYKKRAMKTKQRARLLTFVYIFLKTRAMKKNNRHDSKFLFMVF